MCSSIFNYNQNRKIYFRVVTLNFSEAQMGCGLLQSIFPQMSVSFPMSLKPELQENLHWLPLSSFFEQLTDPFSGALILSQYPWTQTARGGRSTFLFIGHVILQAVFYDLKLGYRRAWFLKLYLKDQLKIFYQQVLKKV